MKFYIAGPISSNMDGYKKEFERVEKLLQSLGFDTVSPAKLPLIGSKTNSTKGIVWLNYMVRTLQMIAECNAVYFIRGWQQSPGARIERIVAERLNLIIWEERKTNNGGYITCIISVRESP